MLQLDETEVIAMVSQNAIPSIKQLGGHLPFAFTEQVVLMLANVLRAGSSAMQLALLLFLHRGRCLHQPP